MKSLFIFLLYAFLYSHCIASPESNEEATNAQSQAQASAQSSSSAGSSSSASAQASASSVATQSIRPCCLKNERYVECPDSLCVPQSCDQVGNPIPCPKIAPGRCPRKPACVCIDGYVRNNKGVCIPIKQCQKCGEDQRFVECPDAFCVPSDCVQLGRPILCPIAIPGHCPRKPGCICNEGYVTNGNSTCIPISQCPSCGGDPNAESGCGFQCGLRCDRNLTAPIAPCACQLNGCQCKSGFTYDPNQKKCVCPSQCTKPCSTNEVYSTCANGGCRKRNCSDIDGPTLCIDPIKCIGGCICKNDYYRNRNGQCVSEQECRKNQCQKPNEVYDSCPRTCPPRECGVDERLILCQANQPCGKPGCRCKDGTYRNPEGVCVPRNECPKPCPKNEVYSTCANGGCGKWNCTQIDEPDLCIDPIKCCGGCVCQKGYLRSSKGKCIPKEDCPKDLCPKPNQVYDPCPLACPPRECGVDERAVRCKSNQPCLPAGCRCIDGTYKDDNGNCVRRKDCPDNCEGPTEEPTTVAPETCPSNLEEQFNAANANFTGVFLLTSIEDEPDENRVMSAFSVFTPIAQLAYFSEGETLRQFLEVLNLASKEYISCLFKPLLEKIGSVQNVVLKLAARIFATDQYPLTTKFLNYTSDVFDAVPESVDFNDGQATANRINEWVAGATNDRIKDIAKPDMFTSDTRLVLGNAIYFLGNWVNQFNPNNTEDRDFYVSKDNVVQIPTMYQQNTFRYGHSDKLKAQMLEMFYKGNEVSCVIVLPDEVDGLDDLTKAIQESSAFYDTYDNLTYEKVQVYLPKIKIESQYNLKNVLNNAGVTDVFEPSRSNLTGILQEYEPLFISVAIQKAFVEINEIGTEAAAANIVVVGTTSAQYPPPKIYIVNCDHPFLLFIMYDRLPLFSVVFKQPNE